MARPTKEGMEYFPHDTDAVNDEKIEALRTLYGNDGYAFYFIMLERIYRSSTFQLDISDAETIQILAKKVAVTTEVFNQMLQTALKRGCFDKEIYEEFGVLTSHGILRRASVVLEKRERMRTKYQQIKKTVSASETTQETIAESTQSKVKKSKEKKSKKEDIPKLTYAEKVTLTEEQYNKLVTKHGLENTLAFIEKLSNSKCANKKLNYASDYHAILNWVVDAVLNKPTYNKLQNKPQVIQSNSTTDLNHLYYNQTETELSEEENPFRKEVI